MALAVGLYLYDSALLLYSNEALLIPSGKDGWIARFGSNKTTFKGKQLFVPNPFWPTQPLFRLVWGYEDVASCSIAATWDEKRRASIRLVPMVWGLFMCTFILLPVTLFGRLGDLMILLVFVLVYLNILLVILFLWLDRSKFNLTLHGFASIAFDFLICPPFALNIVRRLSLSVQVDEDFINAARRLLKPADWEVTQREALTRLDDEIACEEEGHPRIAALIRRRIDLTTEGTPCPAPK